MSFATVHYRHNTSNYRLVSNTKNYLDVSRQADSLLLPSVRMLLIGNPGHNVTGQNVTCKIDHRANATKKTTTPDKTRLLVIYCS